MRWSDVRHSISFFANILDKNRRSSKKTVVRPKEIDFWGMDDYYVRVNVYIKCI